MTAETFVKCFNTMQSVNVPAMGRVTDGPGPAMGGGDDFMAGGHMDMPQKHEEGTNA
jgi:hypothetical protein